MASRSRLLPLLLVAATVLLISQRASARIPLTGYFCGQCDANPKPAELVNAIHPAYTTVIFSFIGWDETGNVTNAWDCNSKACPKNFTLTPAMVSRLKAQGRTVLMSVGGQAGQVITGKESPQFISTFAAGLVATITQYGLDGIDLDIENRMGDVLECSFVVASVVKAVKAALPSTVFTIAPQMPDLYPDITEASLGFNAQAPLVSLILEDLQAVQVQMYNTWAAVETIAYAEAYAPKLVSGYSVTATGQQFNVKIPNTKLVLGYPASPSGAGSGFIAPSDVVAMAQYFEAKGTPLLGLMTWSIGWDQLAGWQFATAAMQG